MNYFLTSPLVITDFPADDQHKGGIRRGYKFIVMHSTVGTDSKLWLSRTSPLSNPVSIHRLIAKDGTIYKIVADDEVAWHAGPARVGPLPVRNEQGVVLESVNNWSLGIELENLNNGIDPYPDAQINSAVNQVLEWWGLYGAMPIVAHSWIQSNKTDPQGFNWPQFYSRLFARLKAVL